MSEQAPPFFKREKPSEIEVAYCSLGNRLTYIKDEEGKSRVIARAAFLEQFQPQKYPVRAHFLQNQPTLLTFKTKNAIIPLRKQIKQKRTHITLERNHHDMSNRFNGESRRGNYTPEEITQAKDQAAAEAAAAEQAAYDSWNSSLIEDGSSAEDAYEKAMQRKKLATFNRLKDDVYGGSVQGRRLFTLANQIRTARLDFEQKYPDQVASGEYENNPEFVELLQDRADTYNALKDRYAGDVSEEHQQFFADYAHGDYDDLFEETAAAEAPAGEADQAVEDESAVEEGEPAGEPAEDSQSSEAPDDSIKNPRDRGFKGAYNDVGDEDDAPVYGPHLVYGPHPGERAPMYGPHPNEAVAANAPSRIGIDTLIEEHAPHLYEEYSRAYDEYVEAHAAASYTDFGALADRFIKKGGWVERTRNKIAEKLNTSEHKRRVALEKFEEVSVRARKAAVAEYGLDKSMTDEEKRFFRMTLDSDAAYQLQHSITYRRVELDEKKTTVSRKAAAIGGASVAIIAGAATAIADGSGRGDNHWGWLGLSVAFGAAAGYDAWKFSRKDFAEGAEARASDAREAVTWNYLNSDSSMEDESMATNATEYITNSMQEDGRTKALISAAGGAALSGVAHYGVDALSSVDYSGMPLGLESTVEPTATAIPTEAPTDVPTVAVAETPESAETPTQVPTAESTETPASAGSGRSDGNGNEKIVDLTGDAEPTKPTRPAVETIEPPEETETAAPIEQMPGGELYVPEGGGFTDVLQGYANENGMSLSSNESYELYQYLDDKYGAENVFVDAETYTLPNGDTGIIDPGSAKWATPDIEADAREWMQNRGK